MRTPLAVQVGKPAEVDITHIRNDTFIFPFRAFTVEGDAYDFTDHEFLMEIKAHISSDKDYLSIPDSSFSITQDDLGVEESVNNLVMLTHADTYFDKSFSGYVYDIQMTLPSGVVVTIINGTFNVVEDVSQNG